jgi:hypothetical protein
MLQYNIKFTFFVLLSDTVRYRPRGRHECARYCRGKYYIAFTNTSRLLLTEVNKQTPWPLVRERTIPTDRPPLVDEI